MTIRYSLLLTQRIFASGTLIAITVVVLGKINTELIESGNG